PGQELGTCCGPDGSRGSGEPFPIPKAAGQESCLGSVTITDQPMAPDPTPPPRYCGIHSSRGLLGRFLFPGHKMDPATSGCSLLPVPSEPQHTEDPWQGPEGLPRDGITVPGLQVGNGGPER
ncbi:hypothetical protein H1C71_007626, partial [Ictidomys tridecemlineatus]